MAGAPGRDRSYWAASVPHMFPVVQTSISRGSRLDLEAGSGSMPVAISASRFKQNGYGCGAPTRGFHLRLGLHCSCRRHAKLSGRSRGGAATTILILNFPWSPTVVVQGPNLWL